MARPTKADNTRFVKSRDDQNGQVIGGPGLGCYRRVFGRTKFGAQTDDRITGPVLRAMDMRSRRYSRVSVTGMSAGVGVAGGGVAAGGVAAGGVAAGGVAGLDGAFRRLGLLLPPADRTG